MVNSAIANGSHRCTFEGYQFSMQIHRTNIAKPELGARTLSRDCEPKYFTALCRSLVKVFHY
jgi:hypothetical protein